MNDFLSDRANSLQESGTIAMAKKSRELLEKGINVINFTLGEPDFDTPDFVKDAAIQAIKDNHSHYTPVGGINNLKKAIIHKLKRDNGGEYSPNNIVVSTGAKQSLMNTLISLLNVGDEAVIFAPYWVSYKAMIEHNGATPVVVTGNKNKNFKISPGQLEKAITAKTKVVLINSPSNPSGTVYSQAEVSDFVEVIKKNKHLILISDEMYEHINYTAKTTSFASFPEIKDRTVIINGLSKSFAMTGWRLGFLAAPEWLARTTEKIQGQYTSGTNSITQHAAVTAFNTDPKELEYMKKTFAERKDLVMRLLSDIDGVNASEPEGAFYVFPDISHFIGKSYEGKTMTTSLDIALFLLEVGHVATVSGGAFGMDEHIRISFATSSEHIAEGMKRIRETLLKLS